MRPRTILEILVLAIVGFGAATVNAQSSESLDVGNIVDGAMNPEKIHYATKIRTLLILYDAVHRQGLAALLSESDSAIIEGMVGAQEFNLAAEQGDVNGAELRAFIEGRITPDQIAEAQRLAREWMEEFEKRKEE